MNANPLSDTNFIPLLVALYIALAIFLAAPGVQANESTVVVEEIDLSQPSNATKAAELWDQTKQKTGEAASTAAEFTKVQSTRALQATKQGIAKGANAVSTGSKKAWKATKEATHTAVEYTSEKAVQAGHAISKALSSDKGGVPVTERSVNADNGSN